MAQIVKNPHAMQKTLVWSLDQEDLLEKGMATHSSILVCRIPWAEEPGGLQPMGLQRVGQDWMTNTFTFSPGYKPDQGRSVLRSYMPTYTRYMPMSFSWTTILMTLRRSIYFPEVPEARCFWGKVTNTKYKRNKLNILKLFTEYFYCVQNQFAK